MKALVFLAACALAGLTVPAAADCECLANGKSYKHGQVACLTLPTGQQLARCGMVLNNSSWKKIQDGCPEAALMETLLLQSTAHDAVSAEPDDLQIAKEPRG